MYCPFSVHLIRPFSASPQVAQTLQCLLMLLFASVIGVNNPNPNPENPEHMRAKTIATCYVLSNFTLLPESNSISHCQFQMIKTPMQRQRPMERWCTVKASRHFVSSTVSRCSSVACRHPGSISSIPNKNLRVFCALKHAQGLHIPHLLVYYPRFRTHSQAWSANHEHYGSKNTKTSPVTLARDYPGTS